MNRVFSFQGTSAQRSREDTKTTTRPYSISSDQFRRNRIGRTGEDKNEPDGLNRKALASNKDNEEAEVPLWKKRLEEREREREKERREREKVQEWERKKQEKERESERQTEREKEKEKVKEEKEEDDSSQSAEARARRRREKRRGTGVSVIPLHKSTGWDIPFFQEN